MVDKYHKILQSYDKVARGIYDGRIDIEEKVDGSQFKICISTDGTITCASHNSPDGSPPDMKMFGLAIEQAERIFEGYNPAVEMTVYCEYLKSPKHNTIAYGRVPKNNLIIFDVKRDTLYMNRVAKEEFALSFGMEVVPLLYSGDASVVVDENDPDRMDEEFKIYMLKNTSILGHDEKAKFRTIEGFVVKNYEKLYDVKKYRNFEQSTHPWMCIKIVNEKFKENNHDENPNRTNKFDELKKNYRTEARMLKTIQRAHEEGLLKGELSDLRILVPMVIQDIIDEEEDRIKDALWRIFGKEITGNASKEMIDSYKKWLEDHN